MSKESWNRIGFDKRTEEFVVRMANTSEENRIPCKDFSLNEVQPINSLFSFLDRINLIFPDLPDSTAKLFISEPAMEEIRALANV